MLMHYLKDFSTGLKFTTNGLNYVVIQHEANMTEVWCVEQKRYFAFWTWTKVTYTP